MVSSSVLKQRPFLTKAHLEVKILRWAALFWRVVIKSSAEGVAIGQPMETAFIWRGTESRPQ
jgi:hypothetical protein